MSTHRYGPGKSTRRDAAGVLLRARDTGRILLGRRSSRVSEPGTWTFFGGGIERGETSAEAARRELEEEAWISIGVSPSPAFIGRGGRGLYFTHVGEVAREVSPVLNWEHDDWGWFSPRALPARSHPGVGAAVRAILGRGGRRAA